jgi:hypothetical protein
VDFVGAGPGDPDLLTLRARRVLDRADVVVFDRLVTPAVLDLARREALMIDAGKEGFGPATPQAEIDALIVRHALKGRHVVRLKSGDPTVFGRLDEEMAACETAGVPSRSIRASPPPRPPWPPLARASPSAAATPRAPPHGPRRPGLCRPRLARAGAARRGRRPSTWASGPPASCKGACSCTAPTP